MTRRMHCRYAKAHHPRPSSLRLFHSGRGAGAVGGLRVLSDREGWTMSVFLKNVLGASYGGPALGFRDGEFILYVYNEDSGKNAEGDSVDIIARGKTLELLQTAFRKRAE